MLHRKLRGLVPFVLLALALSNPIPASAYSFTGNYFNSGSLDNNLQVCFGNGPSGLIYVNRAMILSKGANVWRAILAVPFESTGSCQNPNAANIRIREFHAGGCGTGFNAAQTDSGGLHGAVTYMNIWVNLDCPGGLGFFYWGATPVPGQQLDGVSIVAHEVGHALGLCHSNGGPGCDGSGNGQADLMDQGGPHNADCTTLTDPFQGRRIDDISFDDFMGIRSLYDGIYGQRYTIIGPPANSGDADCVG